MLKTILACAALAGTALAQVAMPPHSTTYNGYSRGWSTTAQVGFAITQLDLPLNAQQPGDTGAFLILVNSVQVHHSTGHTTLPYTLPSPIVVQPGDILRVVGNWSPAAPGQFTAHNSYASGGGTYSTNIEGAPHTLYRAGQQWDVGDPAFGGTGFEGLTGNIGRVIIYTSPLSGYASKVPFGEGCYNKPRMVYEQIVANTSPIDLVNTQWQMIFTPNANGGNYLIIPGGAPYDATTAAANGIDLLTQTYTSSSSASWDDGSIIMSLPASFGTGFPFPAAGGGSTTQITVNSNAKVYLGSTNDSTFATNGSNYASTAPFQGLTGAGLPVLSPFNVDLDPTTGGHIWYEDPSPGGGVRITWDNILNWQDPTGPTAVACDVQMEILPSGIVTFAYGASLGNGGSAGNDIIVGYSAGNGEALSTPIDWSAITGYATGDGSVPLTADVDARPVIGTTVNVSVDNVPAGAPFAAVIYGLTQFNPGLPLTSIGMDGCFQYTSQDSVSLVIAPGASISSAFAIPNNSGLSGVVVNVQGAAYAPGLVPNPLGAVSSNGVELVIDVN